MEDEESEWYDSFGESYDDGPSGAPGAAEPDSDSWKTSTVGKPGRPAAPEEEEEQQALHALTERLRSKEQLLELEATAKQQLSA